MLNILNQSQYKSNLDIEIQKWFNFNNGYIHRDYSFQLLDLWVKKQTNPRIQSLQLKILKSFLYLIPRYYVNFDMPMRKH